MKKHNCLIKVLKDHYKVDDITKDMIAMASECDFHEMNSNYTPHSRAVVQHYLKEGIFSYLVLYFMLFCYFIVFSLKNASIWKNLLRPSPFICYPYMFGVFNNDVLYEGFLRWPFLKHTVYTWCNFTVNCRKNKTIQWNIEIRVLKQNYSTIFY